MNILTYVLQFNLETLQKIVWKDSNKCFCKNECNLHLANEEHDPDLIDACLLEDLLEIDKLVLFLGFLVFLGLDKVEGLGCVAEQVLLKLYDLLEQQLSFLR